MSLFSTSTAKSLQTMKYAGCYIVLCSEESITCISRRATTSTSFFRLCIPFGGLLDEHPPGELGRFSTGALVDNNLLKKMESVAIAIVNRRRNKVLLGLNTRLKQQQQLY